MSTININGKDYEITITLGTLEDLEERGWNLGDIADNGVSVKLALDIAELCTGVNRQVLRRMHPDTLAQLMQAVTEGLSADDNGGEGSGAGE